MNHDDATSEGRALTPEEEFAQLMGADDVRPLPQGERPRQQRPSRAPAHRDQAPTATLQSAAERAAAATPSAEALTQRVEALKTQLAAAQAATARAAEAHALARQALAAADSAHQLHTAELQRSLAKAAAEREELVTERAALHRQLQARQAPQPVEPVSARDVCEGRGLLRGSEQARAIAAIAARWPADLLDALPLADPQPLLRLMVDRLILHGPTLTPTPCDDAVHAAVSPDRCELGGEGNLPHRWRDLAAACADQGVRTLTVVGGSPSYRKQLQALAKATPDLRLHLISGTKRRNARKAQSDLRTSDLVLVWGGTELDHAVSELYTGARSEKVRAIAHRGLSQMLVHAKGLVRAI